MLERALVVCAAALFSTLTTQAGDRPADPKTSTVAQFVTRLAVVTGQDGRDFQTAKAALERLGVARLADAEAPLTDGLVARMAADLGVGFLPPASPEATVPVARAEILARLIGMRFVEREQIATTEDRPTACLSSANRGECVECCKNSSPELTGKFCGRFCQSNVPPPASDPEPEP